MKPPKQTVTFTDLKLSEYEQSYLTSVAIPRYVREGHSAAEAWLGLLLEELQRSGFVISRKEPNDEN